MPLCDSHLQCLVWQVVWDDIRSRGPHSCWLCSRLHPPDLCKHLVNVWSNGIANKAHLRMCPVFKGRLQCFSCFSFVFIYQTRGQLTNSVTKYKTNKLFKGACLQGCVYAADLWRPYTPRRLRLCFSSGFWPTDISVTHGRPRAVPQTQHLHVSRRQGCGQCSLLFSLM